MDRQRLVHEVVRRVGEVAGTEAPVLLHAGRPALWLGPGNVAIAGRLPWRERPQSLTVPRDIGLVALSVDGRNVAPIQLATSVAARSSTSRTRTYGRCQRDRRRCWRVHADRGTPLLGGCSCHSKLSYATGLLRLPVVAGRWRLVVTSPRSSTIAYRPPTFGVPKNITHRHGVWLTAKATRGSGPLYRWNGPREVDVVPPFSAHAL